MTRLRYSLSILCMLVVASGVAGHVFAKKVELTDVQAKLVIMHNFVSKYVSWPGDYALENMPELLICSVGEDDVTRALPVLEKASTENLKVKVSNNIERSRLTDCHVLYIAQSEKKNVATYIQTVKAAPVLTFSAMEGFINNGGMIGLIKDTKKRGNFESIYVRFDLNKQALAIAGVTVDPDAVELAREVIE